MAARSSGLIAGLVVAVVLTVGAFGFMFVAGIMVDERKQAIEALNKEIREELSAKEGELQQKLSNKSKALEEAEAKKEQTVGQEREVDGWRADALAEADAEPKKIDDAVRDLSDTIKDRFKQFEAVMDAMKESRDAFESDEKRLLEEVRIKNDELMRMVRQYEEREKVIDKEINDMKARLEELRQRLKMVQTEALRGRTISDACGSIIRTGTSGTNFVVVNLGSADRMRRGLKFRAWTLRRGYGMGWVRARGQDFIKKNILAGDILAVGRGDDILRYPIVSVGVSREAEEKGVGLAGRGGNDTLKVIGPGVTSTFSVAGVEWDVERATEVKPIEELGVVVKGMIEITEVRKHSSDAVILPERHQRPVCPQCGWVAHKADMKYCVFCFVGDDNDEVQPLDTTIVRLLNIAEDPFLPITVGDRLSNPYFSPNRELVFLLGSQPARQTRQHMKAFIEYNGGRVVEPRVLLVRPEEADAAFREVMPYQVNYLIPGIGPEADDLLKRARELGIRSMREEELYEFFGGID